MKLESEMKMPERIQFKRQSCGYLHLVEPDPDLEDQWKADVMFTVTSAAECRKYADWLSRAAVALESKGQP